jgi:hypothetical protein
MKCLRSVKGCSRIDRILNEDKSTELNTFSLNKNVRENRMTFEEHLQRMDGNHILK